MSIVKEGEKEEVIGIMEVYPKYLFIEFDAPEFSYCLGYYTKKGHRGQGYMTEAVKAVEEELFRQGVSQVTIGVFPRNEASKRVAYKCDSSLTDYTRTSWNSVTIERRTWSSILWTIHIN